MKKSENRLHLDLKNITKDIFKKSKDKKLSQIHPKTKI